MQPRFTQIRCKDAQKEYNHRLHYKQKRIFLRDSRDCDDLPKWACYPTKVVGFLLASAFYLCNCPVLLALSLHEC